MIVCAGKSESFSFAKPIGIGLVESAITLTRLCLQELPEHFLFVGSAGSYGEVPLLDVCVSTRALNLETSGLLGQAYSPISPEIVHFSPFVSRETFPQVSVNSSNYITADAAISKRYLEANCDIENMEFFSVLSVAQHFNIPAFGLFVVTNYCTKDAHATFLAYHEEAKKRLHGLVLDHWREL
ncbi:MAG: purine-nucleoside phosphorylase [Campylobacterales bacterium]|nr:purine-nucleoside phosphorylase [Campylobacterales bacterium]